MIVWIHEIEDITFLDLLTAFAYWLSCVPHILTIPLVSFLGAKVDMTG